MSPVSDTTLVERSLGGDRGAFGEIVDRYKHVVCATALGMVGDHALSEDIGQEAFVEAWRNLHQLREPEHLRSWICTIARSRSIDAARRRGRHSQDAKPSDRIDEQPDPFEELAQKETSALVWAVIERIPEGCRSALILYYRRGQSVREVAAELGVDEVAVKQRLSRGRKHMRVELERRIGKSLEATRPDRRFTLAVLGLLPTTGVPSAGLAPAAATMESTGGGWAIPALLVAGVAGALLAGSFVFEGVAGAEADARVVAPTSPVAELSSSVKPLPELPSVGDDEGQAGEHSDLQSREPAQTDSAAGDDEAVPFSGHVVAQPADVPCGYARLWLTEGSVASYPVGEEVAIAAITDESGRFDLGEVEAGTYRLQVSCREAQGTSGFREVVKTFAVVLPRDDGLRFALEVPTGFEPASSELVDDLPASIAELMGADGRPTTREVPRGWRPDLDAADADGDGLVSDEERRIHDEITSYVLTLGQQNEGEGDDDEEE